VPDFNCNMQLSSNVVDFTPSNSFKTRDFFLAGEAAREGIRDFGSRVQLAQGSFIAKEQREEREQESRTESSSIDVSGPSSRLLREHPLRGLEDEEDNEEDNSEDATDGTNGRWKKDEHQRFIEGLKVLGKNWALVHKLIGTRSSA